MVQAVPGYDREAILARLGAPPSTAQIPEEIDTTSTGVQRTSPNPRLLALHGARGAALLMFVEFSPAALPRFPPRDRSTALTGHVAISRRGGDVMSEMGAVLEAGSACRRNLRFFDMIWAISPWQLFDGGSNVWSQLIQLSIAATRPRNRSTQAFADFESCKFGDLACTNRVEGAPGPRRQSARISGVPRRERWW